MGVLWINIYKYILLKKRISVLFYHKTLKVYFDVKKMRKDALEKQEKGGKEGEEDRIKIICVYIWWLFYYFAVVVAVVAVVVVVVVVAVLVLVLLAIAAAAAAAVIWSIIMISLLLINCV